MVSSDTKNLLNDGFYNLMFMQQNNYSFLLKNTSFNILFKNSRLELMFSFTFKIVLSFKNQLYTLYRRFLIMCIKILL